METSDYLFTPGPEAVLPPHRDEGGWGQSTAFAGLLLMVVIVAVGICCIMQETQPFEYELVPNVIYHRTERDRRGISSSEYV